MEKSPGADVNSQTTKSANELAMDRTDLATKRTVMAADRSLMAWVRTALSMISFGFTIYKILQGIQESGVVLAHEKSPRIAAIFLIGLGTVSMVMGTIEYWQTLREMRHLQTIRIWRPSFVIALIMSIAGLFLFVSIINRIL